MEEKEKREKDPKAMELWNKFIPGSPLERESYNIGYELRRLRQIDPNSKECKEAEKTYQEARNNLYKAVSEYYCYIETIKTDKN